MKTTITLMMTLCILLQTTSALADEDFREFNVLAGLQSTLVQDGTFGFFSDEDWISNGRLAAEIELWNELFIQVGISKATVESYLFSNYDTKLQISEPHLGFRYGYTFLDALRPYVSAMATYTMTKATMDIFNGQRMGQTNSWDEGLWGGRFALGLEGFFPRWVFRRDAGFFKDWTIGGGLEFGYVLRQELELDHLKQGKNGNLSKKPPLPAGNLDLGKLDLSGFYFAIDFRMYF
jgi:hypothetical protein